MPHHHEASQNQVSSDTNHPQVPLARSWRMPRGQPSAFQGILANIMAYPMSCLGNILGISSHIFAYIGISPQHLGNILAYPGICLAFSVAKCLSDFLGIFSISWHTLAILGISLHKLVAISGISCQCFVVLYLGIFWQCFDIFAYLCIF